MMLFPLPIQVILTPSNSWVSDFTIPINLVVGTVPLSRTTISRYLNQLGLTGAESSVSLDTRRAERNSRASVTDALLAATRPEVSAQ